MSIRIKQEPPLELTQAEYEQLHHEYQFAFTHYCGAVPSFEVWARGRMKSADALNELSRLAQEVGQEL